MGRISDIFSTEGAPFQLSGAHTYRLRAAGSGDVYRIDIAIPPGPPPANGWPSIMLLDGAGCFATCVEACCRMGRRPDATAVAPCVIIGIAAEDGADAIRRRQRDFTSPRAGDTQSGGAADFLAFITEQVQPLAARLAPLDAARATLFGHSLAGYFVLWVLASHPHSFRGYAAISPSVWWDRDGLARAFAAMPPDDRHVLLAIGAWEDELPPWQRATAGSEQAVARRRERRMLQSVQDTAGQLRTLLGEERVRLDILADEDHASIISAAIPRALRLASR